MHDRLPDKVWAVSQINQEIAATLETTFARVWVRGEVSSFVGASSGHWYFNLKDANSTIKAVMFRSRNQMVGFTPKVGDTVEVQATLTVYAGRGELQLQVDRLRREGIGQLYEQFLRIRQQLEQQGLFDSRYKLPLPRFVRTVGIITSLQAAALQDVLSTLNRRTPHIRIVIYPCLVQGAEAPHSIQTALASAVQHSWADVLLLVRGGGSMDDLWSYNHPELAVALAHCPIPVISGVGHETDTTIADFVVSQRAATPTAAAELLGPETEAWQQKLQREVVQLKRKISRVVQQNQQTLDYQEKRLVPPSQYIQFRSQAMQFKWNEIQQQIRQKFQRDRQRLNSLYNRFSLEQQNKVKDVGYHLQMQAAQLHAYNPRQVLSRGYAMVTRGDQGLVKSAQKVVLGETLIIEWVDGQVQVEVHEKR